jgi:hypothetical protein
MMQAAHPISLDDAQAEAAIRDLTQRQSLEGLTGDPESGPPACG